MYKRPFVIFGRLSEHFSQCYLSSFLSAFARMQLIAYLSINQSCNLDWPANFSVSLNFDEPSHVLRWLNLHYLPKSTFGSEITRRNVFKLPFLNGGVYSFCRGLLKIHKLVLGGIKYSRKWHGASPSKYICSRNNEALYSDWKLSTSLNEHGVRI